MKAQFSKAVSSFRKHGAGAAWRAPLAQARAHLGWSQWAASRPGRWAPPLLLASLIYLSLTLAAITLDAPGALAARWWPLPLAIWAIGMQAALPGAPRLGWRGLGWILLITLPLMMRAEFSLHGPLPAAGLREALGLAVIAVGAIALWFYGSVHPGAALGLWIGVLIVGGLTAALAHRRFSALDPAQLAAFSSACLAGFIGIGAWSNCARRGEHAATDASVKGSHLFIGWTGFIVLKVCMLMAGVLLAGWAFAHQKLLADPLAVNLDRGLSAFDHLWIESILLGWGSGSIPRLAQTLAEPYAALVPAWGGLTGTLAAGGLAVLIFCLLWGLYLLWRPAWDPDRGPRYFHPLPLAAMPTAFFVMGLIVWGGVHSQFVLFVLAGWTALGLTRPGASRERYGILPPMIETPPLPGRLPVVALLILLFGVMVQTGRPVRGSLIFRRAAELRTRPDAYVTRLYTAQRLNPYDPAIPQAIASGQRERMNRLKKWNQPLYQSVLDEYRRAEGLDPCNALVPLRLAQFQVICGRDEEALATVRKAIDRLPNSLVLIDWLYYFSRSRNQTNLANEMLDQGQKIMPGRSDWWRRKFELANILGQGPLARQALAIALTAVPKIDPDDLRLLFANDAAGD